MKAPVLVSVVVLLHGVAIGMLMFLQGCGTRQPRIEPPPAPVMPPRVEPVRPASPAGPLHLRLPAPAEPAPQVRPPVVLGAYTVKRGDSLSVIAKRHGLSTRELADLNGLKNPNAIRIGQVLMIPGYEGGEGAPARAPARAPSARPPSLEGAADYVVKPGDSLSKIARQFGVKVADVRAANGLSGDLIRIGQKLKIPGATAAREPAAPVLPPMPAPAPPVLEPEPQAPEPDDPAAVAPPAEPAPAPALGAAAEPFPYPVGEGETLESIAKAFLVSPEAIMELNDITDPSTVKPGQRLLIPPE